MLLHFAYDSFRCPSSELKPSKKQNTNVICFLLGFFISQKGGINMTLQEAVDLQKEPLLKSLQESIRIRSVEDTPAEGG